MRKTLALGALALLLATSAMAQEIDFKSRDFVSSEDLRAGKVTVKLSTGQDVRLRDVVPDGDPKQSCMLHIPSVVRALEGNIKGGKLDLSQGAFVYIKKDKTDDGMIFCMGAGGGCKVNVD